MIHQEHRPRSTNLMVSGQTVERLGLLFDTVGGNAALPNVPWSRKAGAHMLAVTSDLVRQITLSVGVGRAGTDESTREGKATQ